MISVRPSKKTKEFEYPKLMSNENGLVVLMVGERRGTCLIKGVGDHNVVGQYYESWAMNRFTDFNDKLTLENC